MQLALRDDKEFMQESYLRIREEYWIEDAGLVTLVEQVLPTGLSSMEELGYRLELRELRKKCEQEAERYARDEDCEEEVPVWAHRLTVKMVKMEGKMEEMGGQMDKMGGRMDNMRGHMDKMHDDSSDRCQSGLAS